MVEMPDQRPEDRVEHQGFPGEAEEYERQIEHGLVDDHLEPGEAKRDNPVHLAVFDAVVCFVKLPEERHAMQHVVYTPLNEIEHDQRDDGQADQAGDRDWSTVAVTSLAREFGIPLHRVHDVRANVEAIRMTEAML